MQLPHRHHLVRPFLRWAGGKQKVLPALLDYLPPAFNGRYFEPFLGGGSLFLANGFPRAEVSDLNPQLINAYAMVRDYPEALHNLLESFLRSYRVEAEAYYYALRTAYNADAKALDLLQAARFIFLNHTSFNGLYRLNAEGEYNVAFGKIVKPSLPDLAHLLAIRERLISADVVLSSCDYRDILKRVKRGDFVYLDPPLPDLHGGPKLSAFRMERFSVEQQIEFSAFAHALRRRGAHVMISIPDVPLIRSYFSDWHVHTTAVRRNISAKRPAVVGMELILTSYGV
jgi:DNA adenine methylase